MTFFIRNKKVWSALPYGEVVTLTNGDRISYESIQTWYSKSPEELELRQVVYLAEPVAPAGKQIVSFTLQPNGDKPSYDVVYRDLTPPAETVPERVFDYQFAGEAEALSIISKEACDAWVGPGVIPEILLEAVEKMIPDEETRRPLVLFLMGSKEFPRNHPNTNALAPLFGLDRPEKIDEFFISASKR